MIDPVHFLLEETKEEAERKKLKSALDRAKSVCLELLAKAHSFYQTARTEPPSPIALGRAISYLLAFKSLAPAVGISQEKYGIILSSLASKLSELSRKLEAGQKTVLVKHERDPEGVKIDKEKLEVSRKQEERREEEIRIRNRTESAPNSDAMLVEDIVKALVNGLGYDRKEAHRRAVGVYRKDGTLEELIMEACRLK